MNETLPRVDPGSVVHVAVRRRVLSLGLLGVGVLASGCGDPRLGFAGTWKGPMKTTVRFSDGSSSTYPKGEVTVVISAPERSNSIVFNGQCGMTATPNDDRAFTISKKACPGQRITFADSAGTGMISCDLVETVGGGSGTRATGSLTVSYFGDSQISRCTNGGSALATYTTELTLTEQ